MDSDSDPKDSDSDILDSRTRKFLSESRTSPAKFDLFSIHSAFKNSGIYFTQTMKFPTAQVRDRCRLPYVDVISNACKCALALLNGKTRYYSNLQCIYIVICKPSRAPNMQRTCAYFMVNYIHTYIGMA